MSSSEPQPVTAFVSHTDHDRPLEHMISRVVECAPNGVAVTLADGQLVLGNAELGRMFGYSPEELLQRQIESLISPRFRTGHAQLRGDSASSIESRAMGAGRELFGLRADGTEFPIEIGLGTLETPAGPMIVETIVDISVRKSLERLFQKVVEAAPCGLVMIDSRSRIAFVNPHAETMFGYERIELIGGSLEMLVPERLRGAHQQHREGYAACPVRRQMGVDSDLTARRKDGSEFAVEIGLSPVVGDDGGLVLATVTDITQRKAMQSQLRRANADLEEFTCAASHDLRSPLRGISDLLEWVVEDLGPGAAPDVLRNLGRASDRIHRLERIIEDLLTYARSGASSSEPEPTDPLAVVDSALSIVTVPPGFRVTTQVTSTPFLTTRVPLETVLRNLLSNAVKHHDRTTGTVDIHVTDEGRYCLFTITDDGPGIPAGSQQRVFRMFQTLSAQREENSGIGLALCRRLVESHGGRISLQSTDGQRGTVFKVWWPRFQWRKHEQ